MSRWPPVFTTPYFLLCLALCGCDEESPPELMLQTGHGRVHRFSARSGYAQYVEQLGGVDTLRIVVASYPLRCHEYKPPPDGEVLVTVTVSSPPGGIEAPGRFHWTGTLPVTDLNTLETEEEGAEASALPFVRLAREARALPAGGQLALLQFDPTPHAMVAGEFQFSDASQGESARAALFGPFQVPLCAVQLDPMRSREAPHPTAD